MCVCLVTQSCPTLQPIDNSLPGTSVHGDSPDKNTGMGCRALFQEILPTQGSNPGHPRCRQIPYHLSPQRSPVLEQLPSRILEWVAMPSSRGSSQPRDWTQVSYVSSPAYGFFTTSATWQAPPPRPTKREALHIFRNVHQIVPTWWNIFSYVNISEILGEFFSLKVSSLGLPFTCFPNLNYTSS